MVANKKEKKSKIREHYSLMKEHSLTYSVAKDREPRFDQDFSSSCQFAENMEGGGTCWITSYECARSIYKY